MPPWLAERRRTADSENAHGVSRLARREDLRVELLEPVRARAVDVGVAAFLPIEERRRPREPVEDILALVGVGDVGGAQEDLAAGDEEKQRRQGARDGRGDRPAEESARRGLTG